LKIFTWNICKGGNKARRPLIEEAIVEKSPHIVFLTEYRRGSRGNRFPMLTAAPWNFYTSSEPPVAKNGILCVSRFAVIKTNPEVDCLYETHRFRWLETFIEQFGLYILAVHVPDYRSGDLTGKEVFLQRVLDYAQKRVNDKAIIIGDLNTGLKVDSEGTPFFYHKYIELLNCSGWVDSWRYLHPDAREFTWYSRKGGPNLNGFRLDYAYVSPPLKNALNNAIHFHEGREQGLSDHSSLQVELEM